MLELALHACLLWAAPIAGEAPSLAPPLTRQADEKEEGPSPELVEETCARLKEAFSKGSVADQAKAIEGCRDVVHEDVIALVFRGLDSKERELREAALNSLRWMKHPKALKRLHTTLAKDKKLRKDAGLMTALLKAIGQHAHPDSIAKLADDPFSSDVEEVLQARIFALGNIRKTESVKELIGMMRKASSKRRDGKIGKVSNNAPQMGDFRLALMVLTGTDQGTKRDLWERWWNNNKRDFEVTEELPTLAGPIEKKWRRYWGLERTDERRKRREERGQDR